MHVPIYIVVPYATRAPTYVMTGSYTRHHQLPIETSDSLDYCELGVLSASYEAKHNTVKSEALQAGHENVHTLAKAVHCKLSIDW